MTVTDTDLWNVRRLATRGKARRRRNTDLTTATASHQWGQGNGMAEGHRRERASAWGFAGAYASAHHSGQRTAQPFRYIVDRLAVTQLCEDFFPKLGAPQGRKDLLVVSLLAPESLNLLPQSLLRLPDRNFVDAIGTEAFTPGAWSVAVALRIAKTVPRSAEVNKM